ncbi:hypothetical protein PUF88_06075 [Lactobacillaceae bacterium L1_55_11]|nr:hypothetical protein [Lactobacillaceae bacterium L1_55_11]
MSVIEFFIKFLSSINWGGVVVSWLQRLSPSFITILGVWWTIRSSDRARREEHRQAIKPIILGEFNGFTGYMVKEVEPEVSAGTFLVQAEFEVFRDIPRESGKYGDATGYVFSDTKQGLSQMTNLLDFELIVQGTYPARNVIFEGFHFVNQGDNQIMNFHDSDDDSRKNFRKISEDVPNPRILNVLVGKDQNVRIVVRSSVGRANLFFNYVDHLTKSQREELIEKLSHRLIPIEARFTYTDVDGRKYNDLNIPFFVGLDIDGNFIKPIFTSISPQRQDKNKLFNILAQAEIARDNG